MRMFFAKVFSKLSKLMLYELGVRKPVNIYAIKVLGTKNKYLYVGKTTQDIEIRYLQHIRESQLKKHKNKRLQEYLLKQNHCCTIIPLETCANSNADNRERYWIKKLNNSSLTNILLR